MLAIGGRVLTYGGGIAFFAITLGSIYFQPDRTPTEILAEQLIWIIISIVVTAIGVVILNITENK